MATHAGGVLARLEAEGVIEDRSRLTPDGIEFRDQFRAAGGTTAVTLPDGVEEVRVTTTVPDGRLSVGVRPETGHAYAVLDASDDRLRFDEVGVSSVSTQSYTCRCRNEICDWPYTIEVCRDGVTGEIVDTNCVC